MILIDTHVHIYSCFNLKSFFDSTLINFQNAANNLGAGEDYSAILILTDWEGKNWFKKLAALVNQPNAIESDLGDWVPHPTQESSSLYFKNKTGHGFYIVAGRKIITSENLEALALATDDTDYPNGLSLLETVDFIQSKNSIPVIPWAVGKWLGKRGKNVDELIAQLDEKSYFLCDNSNRPFFWPKPKHFKIFEAKGGKLLSGSDPLHFPSEERRAGSFGCWAEGSINADYPSKDLKALLNNTSSEIKLYGPLENPYRFFKNQISMQLLKRKWQTQFYKT